MLAYSSIAHAGYHVDVGVAAGNQAGLRRAVLPAGLCVHHIGAFAALAALASWRKAKTRPWRSMRGLGANIALAGAAMALFMLSLTAHPTHGAVLWEIYVPWRSDMATWVAGARRRATMSSGAFFYLRVIVG